MRQSSGEPATVGALLRGGEDPLLVLPWTRRRLLVAVAGGIAYGLVMGSYGLRPLQALYSGLKVPLLLGATTLLGLPSFYALNSVLGLRDHFAAACRAIVSAQATLALALAALAPVTAVYYAGGCGYHAAILLNGLQFALATLGAQAVLRRNYRRLESLHPRHRWMRRVWAALYVFIAIQLAWVLRPYIGAPEMPTAFVRQEAWDNAYVKVLETIAALLRRY